MTSDSSLALWRDLLTSICMRKVKKELNSCLQQEDHIANISSKSRKFVPENGLADRATSCICSLRHSQTYICIPRQFVSAACAILYLRAAWQTIVYSCLLCRAECDDLLNLILHVSRDTTLHSCWVPPWTDCPILAVNELEEFVLRAAF